MNDSELRHCVESVADPELGQSLGKLNMVKQATISDAGVASIEIELPTPAYPGRERIEAAINAAIQRHSGDAADANVTFGWKVKGKETGGKIGLRIKNVIAVGSGKGGVGKSTTATMLAYGLKSFGAKVGLMDADVYGPSIPHLCGASGEPAVDEVTDAAGNRMQRIQPIDKDGLKLLSIGFMIKADQAVVWRGPMLHKLLTQFLAQTEWGELDYLIIDLPPGTGDVSLTLSQLLGLAGAVIVCTPQKVALLDAVKAISMFGQVNIPVLGIVENMSGEIFGRGGAKDQAGKSGIPFLGEVPITAYIRELGDAGRMSEIFNEDSPVREELLGVCQNIAMQIARQLLDSPALPTLEVL
ncbi:MAG: Mrp/NBP35 family ATP-binding protein [Planctomycetota bacterium]|nr:Mrp/NBP35 family ATP-binding protein [Planctomycetota bacterium]